jgi:hypothetical protein
VPLGHLPLTGFDVPDALGVPGGAQSRPQPLVVLDDVVDVLTAAPPLALVLDEVELVCPGLTELG